MSRIKSFEVDGKKYELFFSTRAMRKLSDRCGSLDEIGEWLDAKKPDGSSDTSEIARRYSMIITELANGAVAAHNADIALGLEQGEKRNFYPEEYFEDVLSIGDITEYKDVIFSALNMGTEVEVPQGIELEETDPDLEELEREARKNSESAQT